MSARSKHPSIVLGQCDGFEMVWADAQPYATQMVEFHSIRGGADEFFVSPSMRANCLGAAGVRLKRPVRACTYGSAPQPTIWRLLDPSPESNANRRAEPGRTEWVAMSPPTQVMHFTEATREFVSSVTVGDGALHSVSITHSFASQKGN